VTLAGSRRVDSKKFPLAAAAGEHTFADFDKRFDQGLRIIIKGFSAGRRR
jgi:TetR/AcrR family tetracycline transcriptional repressor